MDAVRLPLVILLAVSAAVAADNPEPSAPSLKLTEPIEVASAGVRIAVPASQPLVPPTGPATVLAAADGAGKAWSAGTSLDVVRLEAGQTASAGDVLDQVVEALASASRDGKVVPLAEPIATKVDDRDAVRRVVTFVRRDGKRVTLALTGWQRAVEKDKLVLSYVLATGLAGDDAARARTLSRVVCLSVAHIPVKRPGEALPGKLVPVDAARSGFRVGLPVGWFVSQLGRRPDSSVVLASAAVDQRSGRGLPNLNVATVQMDAQAPDLTDPDELGTQLEQLKQQLSAAGIGWRYRSHKLTTLGDMTALELVGDYGDQRSARILFQRIAFSGRIGYTLSLHWQREQAAVGTLALRRIAASFRAAQPQGKRTD